MGSVTLSAEQVSAGYARKRVVNDVSFDVAPGEITGIIGANGAGKTTLLRALAGRLPLLSGSVRLDGQVISRRHVRSNILDGLVYVPQGGPTFPDLSVRENLHVAAFGARTSVTRDVLDEIATLFPVLEERQNQRAGALSGGERGMLALARALIARPRMLLLDEPSIGLAPAIVGVVADAISRIHRERGVGILLVEQNLGIVESLASRVHVMRNGSLWAMDVEPTDLHSERVRAAYLT